jgi:hypothetical protein
MSGGGPARPDPGAPENEHGSKATTIGGYVVGPGSVCAAGYYTVIDQHPVAKLPDWITEALTPKTSPGLPSALPVSSAFLLPEHAATNQLPEEIRGMAVLSALLFRDLPAAVRTRSASPSKIACM